MADDKTILPGPNPDRNLERSLKLGAYMVDGWALILGTLASSFFS